VSTRICQRWLLIWLAIAVGGFFGLSAVSAETGKRDELYTLRIQSLPLDQSLQEFARQTGVQVMFFSHVTQGVTAPALNGQYSLADALDTLLASSNLVSRRINAQTVQVVPRPRARAGTGRAADTANLSRSASRTDARSDLEEVTVTASASGLTATRVEMRLADIPQTFSVLTQEQLRQQNATTVEEALSKAPGITAVRRSSLHDSFFSRGFGVSTLHFDGSSALNPASIPAGPYAGTPDLIEFDRIEVMRGADALFGANSSPGATVNLIRKRPLDRFAGSLSGWVGSWNDYRVEGDVTGPLVESGRVRGRLAGVYADHDYFFDVAKLTRRKIFGALQTDITPGTTLTLGGSYQQDRTRPFFTGLPMYLDGSDSRLPVDFALAFDWAHYETISREAYFQLEQAFGQDWKLRVSSMSLKEGIDFAYATLESPIEPVTRALRFQANASQLAEPAVQRQIALDVTVTGVLDLLGRRAEVAFGADLSRFHITHADRLSEPFGPVLDDVLDFDPADFPDPVPVQDLDVVIAQRQLVHMDGVFASLRVHATDALALIGGLRMTNGHYVGKATLYEDGIPANQVGGDSRDKNKFTPYAGVVYKLDPVYSLYASYADIFKSVAYTATLEGVTLRPADGVVIEMGVKSAWRAGALTGALAIYRVEQSGLPERDPRPRPPGRNSQCCFVPSGTSHSKGVDLELSGTVAHDWLIGAGYTYNVNHDIDKQSLAYETPRHLLKAWTSVTLPGALSRWAVGGSLHAQSGVSTSGSYCARYGAVDCIEPVTYFRRQPSYLTLDLRASFEFDTHWRAALTVANVFDKRYYETIDWPGSANWYGEPRRVLLRFDARY
jgi:outer membrane receptor for ferric coprogen and ferric-rhodotorulic acid